MTSNKGLIAALVVIPGAIIVLLGIFLFGTLQKGEATTSCSGLENVAFGKALKTNAPEPSNPLSLIVDGETTGSVDLKPAGLRWLELDLGVVYEIHCIRLWHYSEPGVYPIFRDVLIQLTEDNSTYGNAYIVFNNDHDNSIGYGQGSDPEYTESPDGKTFLLPNPVPARYLLFWTDGGPDDGYGSAHSTNIYQEIQVFGAAPAPPPTPTPTPAPLENVALNKPVTASGAPYVAQPSVVVDGNLAGYTAIANSPHWVRIDLQSDYDVSCLRMRFYYLAGRTSFRAVVAQLSLDGANWDTIFNNDQVNALGFGAGTDSEYVETEPGKEICLGTPKKARYVRVWNNGYVLDSSSYAANTLFEEIQVFGTASAPPPTPTPTPTPLPNALSASGYVGIGTLNPTAQLDVRGGAKIDALTSGEITVTATGWADSVFEDGYPLMSLDEVEEYIKEHGHLPGIPTAEEVAKNGVSVGETQVVLLQKIEELTLYVIALNHQLNGENAALKKENADLKRENEVLKHWVSELGE